MIKNDDRAWSELVMNKVIEKMRHVVPRTGDKIPYTTENGVFDDKFAKNKFWWTNGFWHGILWHLYDETKASLFKVAAENAEQRMDSALFSLDADSALQHDVGFMWHISAGANYKLTGSKESKRRALAAAEILASRFNIRGGYIIAWNSKDKEGWTIIDTMMNLPLLYWASEETGYDRFRYIAEAHADKTADCVVRGDGSVCHIVNYNTETGEVLNSLGGQGCAVGSSWSRGQSWAIYGFALSFAHTGNVKFLDTAKKVAHYFIAALHEDYIPRVDFRSPEEPRFVDTTAGAIAACGILEIAKHVPEYEKTMYIRAALNILRSMEKEFADYTDKTDSILQGGSEAYFKNATDTGVTEPCMSNKHMSIIYGDYYFIEALRMIKGLDISFW